MLATRPRVLDCHFIAQTRRGLVKHRGELGQFVAVKVLGVDVQYLEAIVPAYDADGIRFVEHLFGVGPTDGFRTEALPILYRGALFTAHQWYGAKSRGEVPTRDVRDVVFRGHSSFQVCLFRFGVF